MAKTNRIKFNTRFVAKFIIKLFIIVGIAIFIDNETHISDIFIKMTISEIFGIESPHRIELSYTSMYASIAIIISSDLGIFKKIIYSTGIFFIYVLIAASVTIYIFRHDDFLKYIWFMTILIPILLWRFLYENRDYDK